MSRPHSVDADLYPVVASWSASRTTGDSSPNRIPDRLSSAGDQRCRLGDSTFPEHVLQIRSQFQSSLRCFVGTVACTRGGAILSGLDTTAIRLLLARVLPRSIFEEVGSRDGYVVLANVRQCSPSENTDLEHNAYLGYSQIWSTSYSKQFIIEYCYGARSYIP